MYSCQSWPCITCKTMVKPGDKMFLPLRLVSPQKGAGCMYVYSCRSFVAKKIVAKKIVANLFVANLFVALMR